MISVVIPAKDGGSDLVRCLEVLRRQRLDEDVEIVVVDSGSVDGSPERALRLGARVHEISPEDFDHGRTRNLGAELAQGTFSSSRVRTLMPPPTAGLQHSSLPSD